MIGPAQIPAGVLQEQDRAAYIARNLAYWAAVAARRAARLPHAKGPAYAEYVQPAHFARPVRDEDDETETPDVTPPAPRAPWTAPARPGTAPRFLLADRGAITSGDPENQWLARDTFTDEFRAKAKTESWFVRHMRAETGRTLAPQVKAKRDKEKAILLGDSHKIAKRLEAAGIPAYRSDKWDVWLYLVHSAEAILLPKFRRCVFIPAVAAAVRADHLRSLEHYAACNPFLRFWTFTSGPRCPLSQLRARVRELHRRISRVNAEAFMLEAGVRIVFRSTELGTVEGHTRDEGGRLLEAGRIDLEAGEPMFHPHAHCIVRLKKGPMPLEKWTAFLVKLRAYWGDWMDDGSVIRDMREACKYVTKPRDIHALNDSHLVELYHALHGLKMVQPLDELREQIKARKGEHLILVREDTPDGRIWCERRSPNAPLRPLPDDSDLEEYVKTVKGGDGLPADGFKPMCDVVARTMPIFNRTGMKEPAVVVCGNVWDASKIAAHPLVVRMRAQTRDEFLAAEQIRVHTGTSTVAAGPGDRALPDRIPAAWAETPPDPAEILA